MILTPITLNFKSSLVPSTRVIKMKKSDKEMPQNSGQGIALIFFF